VRHGFQGTKNLLTYLTTHHEAQAHSPSYFSIFFGHIYAFLNNFNDSFATVHLIPWIIIVLFFIPLYSFIKHEHDKKRKYFLIFLLLLVPIAFVIFIPLRNTVWGHFLIELNIVYIFLFTYLLFINLQKSKQIISLGYLLLFIVFIITAMFNALTTWQHDFNDFGGTSKIKGKEMALDYIYNDAKGEHFGLIAFDPAVYTYAYDYLTWWYGNNKYGYIPHQRKEGVVYLLIEKDPSKPWSYQGWLQTVIKTGTVLETRELPNGAIVQKRVFK
jgi:hypothetical protein